MRRAFPVLLVTILAVFLGFFSPIVPKVWAQCDTTQTTLNLENCYLLNDKQTVKDVYTSPAVLINLLVRNGFIIAGFILLVIIIMAGFKIISGGPKGGDQAKQMLETAAVGFLLMFAAYWIIQIIKLITGANILTF